MSDAIPVWQAETVENDVAMALAVCAWAMGAHIEGTASLLAKSGRVKDIGSD